MQEYMTVREVAAIYKVSEVTIRRHVETGRLRAYRVGRQVRIRQEDVERALVPLFEGPSTHDVSHGEPPFDTHDPLFALVGIGESGIPGGISGDKYAYLDKLPDRIKK